MRGRCSLGGAHEWGVRLAKEQVWGLYVPEGAQ